jgi:hypothetical protein
MSTEPLTDSERKYIEELMSVYGRRAFRCKNC